MPQFDEQRVVEENLLEESTSLNMVNPPPELLSSNMQDGTKGSSSLRHQNSKISQNDLNDRESVISPDNNGV